MEKEKSIIAGFDIGGAHLKVTRAENGRIVEAATIATPLWQGLDKLTRPSRGSAALCRRRSQRLHHDRRTVGIFPSRDEGIATLLGRFREHFPSGKNLIYAGRSGFVGVEQAARLASDVASANWHATAALVAKLAGDALFVDMGSTTTDIIPIRTAPSPAKAIPTPSG